MASDELKKNVGVRRLTPTYVVGVIAALSFAMLGCGGETASAGTVRVVKSFDADYPLTELAWHPNGKELAVGQSLHRMVTVWDVTTGKLLRSMDSEPGAVNALAYSPDGRYLAVGRGFNIGAGKAHVHLYDAASGTLVRSFIPSPVPRSSNEVAGLAFSPDGQYLLTNGYQGESIGVIYRIPAGDVACAFKDNDEKPHIITSLAYSPDGRVFAVGRIDGTLELWSAGDCKQV